MLSENNGMQKSAGTIYRPSINGQLGNTVSACN